jgi:hypothetical protein
LDLLPFKPDSPYSTRLLKHYVEGSGELYTLRDIPREWQEWIIRKYGTSPGYYNVDPYNVGLYDLQNSLGHFDLTIRRNADGTKTYTLRDMYEFGFRKGDKKKRHGFPLGDLDRRTIGLINRLLPEEEYTNPGGFRERWEIRRVGRQNILFIPQEFLAKQGKPFPVRGSFTR